MRGIPGWRRWLYVNLDPSAGRRRALSPLNRFIIVIIVMAVLLAIFQSEPDIYVGNESLFRNLELAFSVVFLAEYVARIWIAGENPDYGPTWSGRLRYAVSFSALIDLVALVSMFATLMGSQGAMLRMVRLVRIIALAKLGRYSTALNAIANAIHSRRYELLMSLAIAGVLLLISSTLLYMVESAGQPEKFGSILRAMWWSIATLTTVGYGDVYPITPLGKVLAGITAVTGIGLIAIPTGILASAFSDALQKQRDRMKKREQEATEQGGPEKAPDRRAGP